MFVLEVSKPSGVCLAATVGDRIIGYLVCSRYADVFHLMNVAVDPDLRRRGTAILMVERMLEEAGREQRYTLEVRVSNHGAIAMYERLGFRRAGRRRRYYSDNGEDAMIMWLGEPGLLDRWLSGSGSSRSRRPATTPARPFSKARACSAT